LRMEGEAGDWHETAGEKNAKDAQPGMAVPQGCLLEGAKSWAEVVRARMLTEEGRGNRVMAPRVMTIDARRMRGERMDMAGFARKTEWNYLGRS